MRRGRTPLGQERNQRRPTWHALEPTSRMRQQPRDVLSRDDRTRWDTQQVSRAFGPMYHLVIERSPDGVQPRDDDHPVG